MPVENISVDNGQGIITQCSGVLGAQEFITAISERYKPDEALRKIRYYITDHTGVEQFELSTEDIIELTKITTAASRKNPLVYLASVVPSRVSFGLVRMWHGYAYELAWPTRLCRSREEAEQWLREEISPDLTFH